MSETKRSKGVRAALGFERVAMEIQREGGTFAQGTYAGAYATFRLIGCRPDEAIRHARDWAAAATTDTLSPAMIRERVETMILERRREIVTHEA